MKLYIKPLDLYSLSHAYLNMR